jgi:hypothetical protein
VARLLGVRDNDLLLLVLLLFLLDLLLEGCLLLSTLD